MGSLSYFRKGILHQIIAPLEPTFILQFPTDMVGERIEILAFELRYQTQSETVAESEKMVCLKRIEDLSKDKLVDLSKFKFNWDEANIYDG